jgi:hypothetical protein
VLGKLVFPARTMLEAAYKHVESEPEPPSLVAEGITPGLDRIILDCLAKRPDERPASAGALRERLEGCPLPAPWTPSDAAAWWSRHMPAVADDGPLWPITR